MIIDLAIDIFILKLNSSDNILDFLYYFELDVSTPDSSEA